MFEPKSIILNGRRLGRPEDIAFVRETQGLSTKDIWRPSPSGAQDKALAFELKSLKKQEAVAFRIPRHLKKKKKNLITSTDDYAVPKAFLRLIFFKICDYLSTIAELLITTWQFPYESCLNAKFDYHSLKVVLTSNQWLLSESCYPITYPNSTATLRQLFCNTNQQLHSNSCYKSQSGSYPRKTALIISHCYLPPTSRTVRTMGLQDQNYSDNAVSLR